MRRTPYPHSDRELVARIGRSPGGRAGYKQLIRELGLGGGRERRLLLEQLTRMVARRELAVPQEGFWAVPKPPMEDRGLQNGDKSTHLQTGERHSASQATISRSARDRLTSGRLELHRDGFGFVRPELTGGSGGPSAKISGDIFIPPNALHGAMHGDLVLVDEDAPGRDGRRSGQVARVLTRRNPTLVGIFHYGQMRRARPGRRSTYRDETAELQGNYVQPWDERHGGAIHIPPGADVVPVSAASPHRTLGPEARSSAGGSSSAQTEGLLRHPSDDDPASESLSTEDRARWPLEGLAVEVEITTYATAGRPAVGRVLEVLGPPDAFGVDVEIMIRKHGIPHTFPTPVLAEAEERAEEGPASLPADEFALREDFRGLPTITIDGETARDFDDAVYVCPLENGNTELQVHIADVSHYVRAGSPLDTEARFRGTSVYFPDRAVPMLPHALSSNMCSLLPREDRLVLSCIMEIDAQGEVVGYRVAEGLLRSARRMTYTSVQHCLNASPRAELWNAHQVVTSTASTEDQVERERIALEQPELPAEIDRMLELALRLNRKRVRRGSIDFDLPEPVVEFDPDGNMKAIVRSERGWAHRLIEEFMLSANECVATWLTAQAVPSIYRIHELPDPKRIMDFEETASAFGQTLGVGALPVKRLTMKSDRRDAQRRSARGRESKPVQAHEIPEKIPVTPQMYQRLIRKIAGKPEERILSYLMLRSLKQARYAEKNEGHFALASPCYTHFTSPIRRYPDLVVHRLLRHLLRRSADPQGSAVLSTDPQPWKAERRAKAAAATLGGPATGTARLRTSRLAQPGVPAQTEPETASRRTGRIGWGQDDTPAFDLASPLPSPLKANPAAVEDAHEPIAAQELADIALESSQAERRAADAERELIEWKKMKFMAGRIGDDFKAIILSVTKFGFFVELDELFIEGLVPLGSLAGDFYTFRDADRVICGARTGHCFHVGNRVDVILDRIDRQQRRLQFALTPGTEPAGSHESAGLRKRSGVAKPEGSTARAKEAAGKRKKSKKRRK